MNQLNPEKVIEYASKNAMAIQQQKIELLQKLNLSAILPKNPYLLQGLGNFVVAGVIVTSLLDKYLALVDEKLLEDFLKDLAVFIAGETCSGHKSTAQGVDLEFINNEIHYVVSTKSGPSWGNSSQQDKLEQDFKNAVIRVKQLKRGANVQPVLGICYGKTKTSYLRGYMKVVGQNFWYLISENKDLYTDIIEPIGFRAKEHNESFEEEKGKVINRFTKQFMDIYCTGSGAIDWVKLVEFNSKNFDLDKFVDSSTAE
jgi:hypothetical protein